MPSVNVIYFANSFSVFTTILPLDGRITPVHHFINSL